MALMHDEFVQQMIVYAKSIQGAAYIGDVYYLQGDWLESFEAGDAPEETVVEDMSCWDS